MSAEDKKRLPIYYVIEKELEKMIEKLEPNDRLPTEKQLGKDFSVSRKTIRTAMFNLVRKGLIYRKAGKGTFVSPPKTVYLANILKGFTQEMEELGYDYSSDVIEQKLAIPDKIVQGFFKISEDQPIFFLSRVRYMDEIPVAYQEAYINTSIDYRLEKLLSIDFSGKTSLYRELAKIGIIPDHGEEEVNVVRTSKFISKLLKQPSNACTLSRTMKTCDAEDRPLEHVSSYYRGDRYTFKFTLNRETK
ncbi:MAG: GntR family transcriptional regulator [Kosmotogaceae bacterium]